MDALPQTFSSPVLVKAFSKEVHPDQSIPVPTVPSKKYKALLVDAGGTLILPAKPIEETYAAYGVKYGVSLTTKDIKAGFKRAFAETWAAHLRYEGDGKLFWRYAVAQATGCNDEQFFEELYQHYAKAAAWKLPVGAVTSLHRLRSSGVKLGVLSNFDTRLRPLLQELNVAEVFHSIIVSCEVGYEKPAPEIFKAALRELDVQANETVLLGDDPIADKEGAKAMGIDAWLWRKEINTFEEVADKVLQVGD
ncbi:hypothetical protein GOP47_0029172 [Adiantum capillus-veneris]|nr:hypothetical protein GOP47_0029172 [Adiantum capillus-veneris]